MHGDAAADPSPGWASDRPRARRTHDAGDLVQAAFDSTSALVLVVDADGVPVLVNPALTRLPGWTRAELLARPMYDTLIAPEDVVNARDHVRRGVTSGEVYSQEGDWLDRHGRRRRVWSQNSVLRDADGAPWAVVTVGVDVTEQRRAEAVLRQQAETDELTGLANRAALFEHLRTLLTGPGATGCGLLFADLDGFKDANDRHGHHVGDHVLVEIAARLRRLVEPHDVVARLGGDEFVVLCPGDAGRRLTLLGDLVETELVRPVPTPSGPVHVGVSVGTAVGVAGTDPDELLRAADRRMYRSKILRRAERDAASGRAP